VKRKKKLKHLPSELLKDGRALLERSDILKQTAIWVSNEIEKHVVMDENKFDALSWEQKEAAYVKLNELQGRLNSSVRDLIKLDEEYRKIAKRVNEAYGRQVMEILPPLKFDDPPEEYS